MPSSYSASLRFELQFTGENINVWGDRLNGALQRVDSSIAGFVTVALTDTLNPYALTTANGSADEARNAMIRTTGTGSFTVTIPSVSKVYEFLNDCTGTLTITTGAGDTVTLDSGDIAHVMTSGSGVKQLGYDGIGLKAYISSVAAGGPGGNVPSPIGHDGKWLTNNGTIPFWDIPSTSDLSDYATAIIGLQVAMAVAL